MALVKKQTETTISCNLTINFDTILKVPTSDDYTRDIPFSKLLGDLRKAFKESGETYMDTLDKHIKDYRLRIMELMGLTDNDLKRNKRYYLNKVEYHIFKYILKRSIIDEQSYFFNGIMRRNTKSISFEDIIKEGKALNNYLKFIEDKEIKNIISNSFQEYFSLPIMNDLFDLLYKGGLC